MHARPALQVALFPAPQQGCPEAPQAPHWFPAVATTQPSGVVQATTPPSTACVQQAWPAPPQGLQVPASPIPAFRPEHARVASEQVPLLFPSPQQAWPLAPHAPHWLPPVATMHASGVMQAVMPASAGTPAVEQHTWPEPPHVAHMPGTPMPALRPAQPSPLLQVPALLLPQQICPEAPQAVAHTSPVDETTQVSPVVHAFWPGQQA
jgi:hypothetical protein